MINISKYDIRYNSAIKRWDDALPLGNGKLGSLIYGDGPLKISVDRNDLWDNRPDPCIFDKGFTFQNLVKLSTSGKDEDWDGERYRLFELTSRRYPYPSKLTAGRLEIDFGTRTDEVKSHLSVADAVATVNFGSGIGRIECFLSATEFIGLVRIFGDYKLDLHIPIYLTGDKDGHSQNASGIDTVKDGCMHYPRAKTYKEGNFLYYVQQTHTDLSFGIVTLTVNEGDHDVIYYTVALGHGDEDFIGKAKRELSSKAKLGYDKILKKHIGWWRKYRNRSEISLGDELLERTYYRSYYLFASCSRRGFAPMPLQGVWTADNDSVPPWNGDYHNDANTELSYQSYLKANRLDEGVVFVDYLWDMRETFKKFTKRFFGVDGLLIPGTMSLDGTPIAGWAQYTLSPTMTIWAAQSFDEYWLYTGDIDFLKERAYPFLSEVGEAIYALLREREGKLYLPLSSSPEIFDNRRSAYLEPNSNFDLALLIYLYKALESYAEILGENGKKYSDILAKLDPIAINKDGAVMLDKTQDLKESHRHFSHLMCLYPLHLINYDTEENKRIYEQTMLQIERLGTGWWVGFSFPMAAQIYAMMYNGGAAYEKLRVFAKGFVSDNGFHLNGDFKNLGFSQWHYRPFTLESLFAYCDALVEMLMQDHMGYVHLFPAVPEEWQKKLSFKKLRSRGGMLIDAAYENGKVKSAALTPNGQMRVKIFNNFGADKIIVEIGEERYTVDVKNGCVFEIDIDSKAILKPMY